MQQKQFVKNAYGVDICMCCASCKFKEIDKTLRICTNGEGHVPSSWVCEDWEICPEFEKAGSAQGKVKKKAYLMYLLSRLMQDKAASIAAAERGLIHTRVSIAEIRREFEKKNKTIYEKL